MIRELIQYLSTPATSLARRKGHLKEAVALQARYRRCQGAWQPHLEQTKHTILEAAAACPQRRVVVILGAGSLNDVPLAELSKKFQRVILVDAVFLLPSRALAKFYGAECLVADVTTEFPLRYLPDIDLVVSLNMLSQLPRPYPQEHARKILEEHVEYLKGFSCLKLLITDRNRIYTDEHGNEVMQEDALHGLLLPAPTERWEWHIAPIPEVSNRIGVTHEVWAISV